CERGRNGDLHPQVFVNAEAPQHEVEHGHDDDAATDAEKAGDKAAQQAGNDHRQCEQPVIGDKLHDHVQPSSLSSRSIPNSALPASTAFTASRSARSHGVATPASSPSLITGRTWKST